MRKYLDKLLATSAIAGLILFAFPVNTDAAITLIQTRTGQKTATAGTTFTVTMTTNTTTGNTVIAMVANDQSTLNNTTGITCTGMTFTKIDDNINGGTGAQNGSLWYAFNITGATAPVCTVTVTAGLVAGAIFREYSGLSTTDPLDKHATAKDTSANLAPNSGATATLTGSSDLVVGGASTLDGGNTYTAGATYGNATTLSYATATGDLGMEDKILSGSTAAQTATFSIGNTSDWDAFVATFQAAGGGGGGGTTGGNHTSAIILKASVFIINSKVSIL